MEETPIEAKEFSNKGYVKPFQKGRTELDNDLLFYYDTPCTYRVRKLRPIVAPIKFIQVVI